MSSIKRAKIKSVESVWFFVYYLCPVILQEVNKSSRKRDLSKGNNPPMIKLLALPPLKKKTQNKTKKTNPEQTILLSLFIIL